MATGGKIKLEEGTGGGDHVGFKAPDTEVAEEILWTLPDTDGATGQVMATDGAKTLDWITPALSSDVDAEITARSDADSTLQSNIDAEESARIAADATLQANIDAEKILNNDTYLRGYGPYVEAAFITQSVNTQGYGIWNNYFGNGFPISYFGQTFTTVGATSLSKIMFPVSGDTDGSWTGGTIKVDIYATSGGVPTGSPVASSQTINLVGNLPTDDTFNDFEFVFSTPVSLSASTVYAAVLIVDSITEDSGGFWFVRVGSTATSVYAGGSVYWGDSLPPTTPDTKDFTFTIYSLEGTLVDIVKVNTSGDVQLANFPITPSAAPDADYEVANKKYIDDANATLQAADTTLQSELDTTQGSLGSAVAGNGGWVGFSGTNYLDSELTMSASLITLDSTLAAESTAIDAEATSRSDADATLQANIDAEATSRSDADATLQAAIDAEATARDNADTTLQSELDTTQGSLGSAVDGDGSWAGFSGSNYLDSELTITESLLALDSVIPIVVTETGDASYIDGLLTGNGLAHGLGEVPEISLKVSDGTNYEYHPHGTYFKSDATYIKPTATSLTDGLGSTTPVILKYWKF